MIGLPHALLLDLDGTLVRSEHIHTEGLVRFCAGRGLVLSESERLFVIGHAWQEIYAELRLEARLGTTLAEVLAGTMAAKDAMFAAGLRLPVLDGARELVALAHAAGMAVAIVSGSARPEIVQALAVLEVGELLRFYVGAEDVRHGKPSPEGYALAAERLGAAPERCLVVEDSEAGIAAGLAAGMRVLATAAANPPEGQPGHQRQHAAHRVVPGLAGLQLADLAAVMQP
ncbi:HAD family hydrolase [Nannocystis bainbridge]|uniref:HAD family phosphatase n=1 Tax=Nannocystis bainbridge TaxID=2995303 RepID=A0ABT5EE94_9BACT|nr:HAD family phosphatase [Nannocystis bainbridge]MDC0723273.1 HAD family phosphatase [Nannocystis bainbridge]